MNVIFHKRFDKMASKLPPKVKIKMVERITVFTKESSRLFNSEIML